MTHFVIILFSFFLVENRPNFGRRHDGYDEPCGMKRHYMPGPPRRDPEMPPPSRDVYMQTPERGYVKRPRMEEPVPLNPPQRPPSFMGRTDEPAPSYKEMEGRDTQQLSGFYGIQATKAAEMDYPVLSFDGKRVITFNGPMKCPVTICHFADMFHKAGPFYHHWRTIHQPFSEQLQCWKCTKGCVKFKLLQNHLLKKHNYHIMSLRDVPLEFRIKISLPNTEFINPGNLTIPKFIGSENVDDSDEDEGDPSIGNVQEGFMHGKGVKRPDSSTTTSWFDLGRQDDYFEDEMGYSDERSHPSHDVWPNNQQRGGFEPEHLQGQMWSKNQWNQKQSSFSRYGNEQGPVQQTFELENQQGSIQAHLRSGNQHRDPSYWNIEHGNQQSSKQSGYGHGPKLGNYGPGNQGPTQGNLEYRNQQGPRSGNIEPGTQQGPIQLGNQQSSKQSVSPGYGHGPKQRSYGPGNQGPTQGNLESRNQQGPRSGNLGPGTQQRPKQGNLESGNQQFPKTGAQPFVKQQGIKQGSLGSGKEHDPKQDNLGCAKQEVTKQGNLGFGKEHDPKQVNLGSAKQQGTEQGNLGFGKLQGVMQSQDGEVLDFTKGMFCPVPSCGLHYVKWSTSGKFAHHWMAGHYPIAKRWCCWKCDKDFMLFGKLINHVKNAHRIRMKRKRNKLPEGYQLPQNRNNADMINPDNLVLSQELQKLVDKIISTDEEITSKALETRMHDDELKDSQDNEEDSDEEELLPIEENTLYNEETGCMCHTQPLPKGALILVKPSFKFSSPCPIPGCPNANKRFKLGKHFNYHWKTMHCPSAKHFKCKICNIYHTRQSKDIRQHVKHAHNKTLSSQTPLPQNWVDATPLPNKNYLNPGNYCFKSVSP